MSTFEPRNWRKSRHSNGEYGSCVEAGSDQGRVGIRDTTDRQAGAIILPAPHFAAVLTAARTGALDL